jgi:hypothetical protein
MYCITIWGNTYKTHTTNIFRLQKRALKLCHGVKMHSSDNLFLITNKLPVLDIHKLQTAQLVFQFFNEKSILPMCIAALFSKISDIHRFYTRSLDNLCLHNHFGRLNVRKFCTKLYAPGLWNTIPNHLRQAVSLSSFKKYYKIHLLSSQNS